MSDLPQAWVIATLGEICSKPQYGWTTRASKSGYIKYLRTTDISDGNLDWHSVPFCEVVPADVEKYHVKKNDILVSRAGSVGVSFRVEDVPYETVFASYLIRFNTLDGILSKYVEYYLRSESYWRSISEFSAGIAIPNVNASKLSELNLPLAPTNEQRRIVEKLEKLLGKVDACQKRLERIPLILKRFRQSILAAACSGRLTADWRELNPDVETALQLLEQIQKQRKKRYEAECTIADAGGKKRPRKPSNLEPQICS
jgi:type I restriction enzyme, S subunit